MRKTTTVILGLAMLGSVACGSVESEETLRSEWRYGHYSRQIEAGNIGAVVSATKNINGTQHHAALALEDFYAGSCAAQLASN